MGIIIGSARIDENGHITGGKPGDQKQVSSKNDTKGEVSMQDFYVSSKGWYILRPISVDEATNLAAAMINACNNPNIGYNQNDRYGVLKYGTKSTVKTNADCSSLVRQCVKEATGKDAGDFSTASEADALSKTGKFKKKVKYKSQAETPIYDGDVLVTCTKGHTVIVVSGNPRTKKTTTTKATYYPKCENKIVSIIEGLKSVGEKDTSIEHRREIGAVNNIADVGTATANIKMLNMLKEGKLKKSK